jgi:hypothetical protein
MRAAEEAVERAARRSAIEALLATAGPDRAPPPDDEPPPNTNGP